MSDLPPLPAGFELEGQQSATPPLPAGFTMEASASQDGAKEDKYQKAAREEFARLKAKGVPVERGLTSRVIQGATLNAADELMAGLRTPLEMIDQGTFNPIEGYKYAKAKEDYALEEARKNQGALGSAAEIAGGVLSGTSLAKAGLTAAWALAPNAGLLARSLASGADAAIFGGISGGMEGNTLGERGSNALIGGALGGVVGGATPGALALGSAAISPIVSNIRARVNPVGYAQSQVARSISETGRPIADIADDVSRAAQEGQGMYTLADAMGNSGQRMLSSVTRAPGAGRTNAVEFLDQRQAGQGRRIANTLSEGFDTPQTAAQTKTAMTSARDTAADTAYGAARAGAGPVDVSRVIAKIDDTLQPGVNKIVSPQSGIADDSIESALSGIRAHLTDGRSVQTDFTSLQRLRSDLSDKIQVATRAGRGNQARMLGQVIRELDTAMENASSGFKAANRQFAQGSRNIEAIDEGAAAATRGRTEDIIPAYRSLQAQGQEGYRAGYVDPLIQQAQGAAFGVNKARPLINDAFSAESAAIAPMRTQPSMQRKIGRENTMFETRAQAMGGSKTADNLADQAALGVDPTIVGQVLSGNWGGALKSALSAGSNVLSGNTPAVREEVAKILLQRGQNVSPKNMQAMLDEAIKRIELVQKISQQIGRGASAGLAVMPGATGNRR